jgi:Flp pilus assembly protein TadG
MTGTRLHRISHRIASFLRDRSGVAFVEFAYTLPVVTVLMLGGVEVSYYVTTKMRVSQLALMIADNAARIGSGSQLAAKQISETQINDLLTGAGFQSGKLNLYTNGRVILSSLEPDTTNSTSTSKKYKIAWQRCLGAKNRTSTYGVAGANNLAGMGPTGRQVTAPDDGATMFVEVYYRYKPLITSRLNLTLDMVEIASMPVRDRRDTTQIYNSETATVRNCSTFSAA